MTISQTKAFAKAVKKLKTNQKSDLDAAVHALLAAPESGDPKKGDLSDVRVYKFNMVNQLALLAYSYDEAAPRLTLLALGTHENFYRDMK
ncbi:MAG: addiction module toxin RelE [Spirochaetes bacterium RIFOXYC1_FULL_54_7]|nr:MAG: addiction module toxin RelE [Spirochaetes bacterium RIFOXYC1_FULL_54_7]